MATERDAASKLFEEWSRWTSFGENLWKACSFGQQPPGMMAALDEAADRAFEAEDRLAATPAVTLTAVAGKLRVFAHYCAEQGGDPAPEDRLVLSALADLERMIEGDA